jgi:HPt (histidine-containing phosphotransfer) domain-containing protein
VCPEALTERADMSIFSIHGYSMLSFTSGGPMTSQQYIDQIKSYLSKQFSLGEEQVSAMLPSFISTLSGHMNNLEKAFAGGNLEVLGKSGHTIKGAFLNLGLTDCAEIALQIERKGKEGDLSTDYARLVADLRVKIDVIIDNPR